MLILRRVPQNIRIPIWVNYFIIHQPRFNAFSGGFPYSHHIWTSPLCASSSIPRFYPPRVDWEEGTHWFPTGKLQVVGGVPYKNWGPQTYLIESFFPFFSRMFYWASPEFLNKIPSFHVAFCFATIWKLILSQQEPHVFTVFKLHPRKLTWLAGKTTMNEDVSSIKK